MFPGSTATMVATDATCSGLQILAGQHHLGLWLKGLNLRSSVMTMHPLL